MNAKIEITKTERQSLYDLNEKIKTYSEKEIFLNYIKYQDDKIKDIRDITISDFFKYLESFIFIQNDFKATEKTKELKEDLNRLKFNIMEFLFKDISKIKLNDFCEMYKDVAIDNLENNELFKRSITNYVKDTISDIPPFTTKCYSEYYGIPFTNLIFHISFSFADNYLWLENISCHIRNSNKEEVFIETKFILEIINSIIKRINS